MSRSSDMSVPAAPLQGQQLSMSGKDERHVLEAVLHAIAAGSHQGR